MKNPFYKERLPEWITASAMLLAFIQLVLLSDIDSADGYLVFEAIGIDKLIPICALGVIGFLRVIALYINGSWKRTPLIRAVGAIVGAVFFTLLSFGGYLPALVLAIADVYAGYRAGYDARYTITK